MRYRALANGALAVVIADVDFASEWARIRSANGLASPPSRILEMADAGFTVTVHSIDVRPEISALSP